MKNLLSENMLRFGTKNLSEVAKRELTLKSIMETINEHGLHNAVKRKLNEAVSGQPDAVLKALSSVTVPARTICATGKDYVSISFQVQNTSLIEAYIYNVKIKPKSFKAGRMDQQYEWGVKIPEDNFNITDGKDGAGKKIIGQAEQVNYSAVKKGTTAFINAVIELNGDGMRTQPEEFTLLKQCELLIEYNGMELTVPVTFEGIRIDKTFKVACDMPITLAKGF